MPVTTPVFQYITYAVIILLVGVAEYFHLVTAGTLQALVLLVIGHLFGSIPSVVATNAVNANTLATRENTAATVQAPENVSTLPGQVH